MKGEEQCRISDRDRVRALRTLQFNPHGNAERLLSRPHLQMKEQGTLCVVPD